MAEKSPAIVISERDEQKEDVESQSPRPQSPRSGFLLLWLTFVLACVATIIISHWNDPNAPIHRNPASHIQQLIKSSPYSTAPPSSAPTSACDPLALRREWRTLSTSEQTTYQNAVRCLTESPSISDSGSLYSDFLSTYRREKWNANTTSLYVPWNRWYLHAFERALRRKCHYTGEMVYIDWTQDLEEVSAVKAREFTGSEQGGAAAAQKLISEPEGGAERASYPEAEHISRILSATSYNQFVRSLELNISKLSPLDLSSSEAPNDPSLMHQMQLDRLWWMWQQRNPDAELPVEISVSEISLDGLATPVRVAGITDAEAGGLCYRYI